MGSPVIWNGTLIKTLKQNLNLFDQAYILNGTVDPTSSAQNAPQGSIYLRTGGSGGTAYLKQDAGSTTNWTILSTGAGAGALSITSKTANYTALTTDGLILCNSSGGTFTITLYTAVGNSGKVLFIKKTDNTFVKVSIATTGGQTIEGAASDQLSTLDESVYLVSDGSNWKYLDREIKSKWAVDSYANPTPNNLGTPGVAFYSWKREGSSVRFRWTVGPGTVGASVPSFTLPTGVAIDSSVVSGTSAGAFFGTGFKLRNTESALGSTDLVCIFYDNSDTAKVFFTNESSGSGFLKRNANDFLDTNLVLELDFSFPVTGWGG